ncbi:hypothetical protein PO909_034037 [Leuciscus waleckii]
MQSAAQSQKSVDLGWRNNLEVDASTCAKITDMFSAVASVSKPTVPDNILQKQVNIAHGGEVTSHGGAGGTQVEEQVSDSEVKEGQSEQESVIETVTPFVTYKFTKLPLPLHLHENL